LEPRTPQSELLLADKKKLPAKSVERPPVNPRSAEHYVKKSKHYLKYHALPSDKDDASTDVSSRS
jgi:hypothetical protein